MNREILFKAKRLDNGEWIEGYYEKYNNHHYINKETDRLDTGGYPIKEFIEVDENTICQFTGLTDKAGNKIWENDIVKRYTAGGDEWRISKIVWADYSLNFGWCIEDVKSLTVCSSRLFKVGFDVNDTEKCEVIGNIFDNADLLGKE